MRSDTGEDLISLYREGASQDVQDLDGLVRQAEASLADWPVHRARMREIVHNIKGQGTAFGYDLMTRVGDSLSKLLHGAETVDARILKLLAAHVATLRTVLDQSITGCGGDLGDALASKLEAFVERALELPSEPVDRA